MVHRLDVEKETVIVFIYMIDQIYIIIVMHYQQIMDINAMIMLLIIKRHILDLVVKQLVMVLEYYNMTYIKYNFIELDVINDK
jgi:hypothetical protein